MNIIYVVSIVTVIKSDNEVIILQVNNLHYPLNLIIHKL